MLGMAAGDTAGGAWELGYSAYTEQATVIAYHLIEHGRLNPDTLVDAIRELDGAQEEDPVYRAVSPEFRVWLDRAAAGRPVPDTDASIDSGPRSVPLGVVNRKEPEKLRAEVFELGMLFHADAVTILGGGVVASAVAASPLARHPPPGPRDIRRRRPIITVLFVPIAWRRESAA